MNTAVVQVVTPKFADLFALPDVEFCDQWRELGIEGRNALPADVRALGYARYQDLNEYVQASIDRADRAQRAQAAQETRAPSLPRFWLDDASLTHQGAPYLIKGLLGARLLAMIYGPPGSGKTFFAGDIAAHVAAGLPWRGRRTKPGLVVYVAAEAGASIEPRFVAWRERYIGDARSERVPLAVLTRGVNLLAIAEAAHLVGELRTIASEASQGLALVVIDTLSRSMPGADENAAAEVTRVIQASDYIRDEFGASVLFVHHGGKDATRGARGHSSLTAACDTVIRCEDRVATIEKVRDGVAGDRFPFDLEVASLGVDEDGDPRTTCVVVPAERDDAGDGFGLSVSGLRENQQIALRSLATILKKYRATLVEQGRDPAEARILVSGWRLDCIERRKLPANRFDEVVKSLSKRGLITVDPPHVALVESTP